MRFITEYRVARPYGGPEEGGWWYDDFEPTGEVVATVFDARLAPCIADALTERAARRKGEPDRFSVIGTPDTVYVAEERVGAKRTVERPIWE